MTGQVKEDILVRWGELGVDFRDGAVSFAPDRVAAREWCTEPSAFHHVTPEGRSRALPLPEGSLAFTWCQVPIVYRRGGAAAIRLHGGSGEVRELDGWLLPADLCRTLAARSSGIEWIEVLGG